MISRRKRSRARRSQGQGNPSTAGYRGTMPAMTLAAIDWHRHHATILEINVESYRRKSALKRKRRLGD